MHPSLPQFKASSILSSQNNGKESKLGQNDCYIAGDNKERAVLLIHDIKGWKNENIRCLADFYATQLQAMVYVPDL